MAAMEFMTLSHACLAVRSGGRTLLTDPWLVGSCYWRSWWNYPPVKPETWESLAPDVIYLTHVHWDHFHGPTLKKFPKDTCIVIPRELSRRTWRDLRAMGFTNVHRLAHGEGMSLTDDFRITSYQFSSPWCDSALVIEAEGIKLLDANDCKIMGGPLEDLMRRHGRFDFAFRSHSSANDKACFRFLEDDVESAPVPDDPSTYARSFVRFMDKVRPRYAVPFASNHCHLHREVFHYNDFVTTPADVTAYLKQHGGLAGSELKIMLNGDSWSPEGGFSIAPQTWFTEREKHLEAYREANADILEATYAREARTKVTVRDFERFFTPFFAAVPGRERKALRDHPIVFVATAGDQRSRFLVDVFNREVRALSAGEDIANAMCFEAPALVLRQALAANMFSHVGISKRVIYRIRRRDRAAMARFKRLLAAYEYEVLPLRNLFSVHTVSVYLRRWRELLFYVSVLRGRRAGKTLHQIEAESLS
jgi:UDP-MurNAc hydroxylase